MLLKRLVSFFAAAMLACGCAAVAFADDSSEEKPIKFKYDKKMVVSEKDKVGYTFSFDNKDWKDYVKLVDGSDKVGLSIDAETDDSFQGASLKVRANNSSEVKDQYNVCWELKGSDNKLLYPDVEEDAEGLTTVGIEINAKALGLSTFDGTMMVLTYRFNEKGVDALDGNSIILFSAKKDNTYSGGNSVVMKNTTLSDNVTQYRQALVSVPTKGNSTKMIIEIPVKKAYTGDIITIDNIDICLPDNTGYIKNLDGYNENATAEETVEEIKVKEQKQEVEEERIATEKESSSKSKGVVIIVIVVVVILLAAGGAVMFVKFKAKFY